MTRSINIQLGTIEHERRRLSLSRLAEAVIPDKEAGQRGAKISRLIQSLIDAYERDPAKVTKTLVRLLGEDHAS